MNNIKKWAACACIIASLAPTNANADSLKDLFNSDWGKKLGQIAEETVDQNTAKKLEVADLKGTWKAFDPAVSLRSENVLEQAGGAAIAGIAEEKIRPYYEKLDLDGTEMTINEKGEFTIKIKKIPVKGVFVKNDDGSFAMKLNSGLSKLKKEQRELTAYILKSKDDMSITIDVKKLLGVVEKIAAKTDAKTIGTMAKLLENYDQVCVGLRFMQTAK